MATFAGVEDTNLRDFPRLTGETDDAPRFRRALAAASDGVLAVAKGEYEIGSMICVTNRCSLELHPNAHLKAVREMKYVLYWDVAEGHISDVKGEDGRSPSQRLRQLQFAGLIEDARQFDGAVFSGDFNAQQPWEYDIFKDAGYTCANCSERFGVTATLRDIPADNIIVSPGIEIETFKVEVTELSVGNKHLGDVLAEAPNFRGYIGGHVHSTTSSIP